jgi:hypothetical protein
LNEGRPVDLVQKLYKELDTGSQYSVALSVRDTFREIRDLRRHFRYTRIIVGVRHPVRWFESFYNFRYRHPRGEPFSLEPRN